MPGRTAIGAILMAGSSALLAQEGPLIEEIIVTAQRMEESASKVPIALNAFTDPMLEDRQIVALADLQIHSPNLNYTTNNVGDMNISVRGVGSLVSVNDGESGVSLHLNEMPLAPGQPPIELYDVQRLEVLRGPQGTLYGRNATGGAINIITNKPNFEGIRGYLDAEAGNYDLIRVRGALNLPLGDAVALRIAGLSIDRDGYSDNLAGGQVPDVSDNIDGRDLWSIRASAVGRVSDRTEVWASYERFDENDDRMLTHNFLCKTSLVPSQRIGCEPGEFALEPQNLTALGFGLNLGARGITPLGARDADTGLTYAYPRPTITDLRDVHVDFEPIFELEQDIWQLGVTHDFGWGALNLIGGYQEWVRHDAFDADWSVGPELSPIPQIPDGLYLVSSAPDGVNGLSGERCNVEAGLGGYLGGCVHDATLTRYFQYNDNDEEREQYSAEIRLRTQLDGRANFLVGANYLSSRSHTLETYFDNLFDLLTRIGGLIPPGLQFPGSTDLSLFFYPPFIPKEAKLEFESVSAFGETYVDLTDRLTLTIGVRYNRDEKRIKDRDLFLAAFDFNAPILFNGALGPGPFWIRSDLGNPERPEIGTGLRELYDVPEGADIIQAGTIVPIVDQFNEERLFSGTPSKQTWDAWSGRIGLDWQLTDDALIYGFYSRGYKPGGFNPGTTLGFLGCDCATALEPLLTYDREEVNALEVGMKTRLLNGSVSLNVAAFYNDYDDLQLSETAIEVISTATSNGNIDAKMYGSELEARWRPVFAPRAEIEFAYSWLHARAKDVPPRFDPNDPTGGNPDFVTLQGNAPSRFVAKVEEVLPLVPLGIATFDAIGPDRAPAAQYPNGIPAWWLGDTLRTNGVTLLESIPVDVSGNHIPETPEHSIHLAASYSWDVAGGQLTARWDYYWQDSAFMTIYNRPSHKIDSWDQHNATLIYEAGGGRWSARAWIKNIENEIHITGGHRSNVQAFAVSDPRAYGASLRYNFGTL